MDRQQVFQEVEQTFGFVPGMFTTLPDNVLESEWRLFRAIHLDDDVIPMKYRELLGVALAAALGDPYCAIYHTEVAKLCGCSDQEIEAAIVYAKNLAGWRTYVSGKQPDLESFRQEVRRACEHVARGQKQPKAA